MIIDCISDLHGEKPELEGGDLLIVAGDLTATNSPRQHFDFFEWIFKQSYNKKVIIAGNHDGFFLNSPRFYSMTNIDYLCDSGIELEIEHEIEEDHWTGKTIKYSIKTKIKIWGSPWTMTFPGINPHCKAFTLDSKDALNEKWKLIPDDIDILITHCPPYGILDYGMKGKGNEHYGSGDLYNHVIKRIKPKLHVFGHIHEHGGNKVVYKNPGFGVENNICFVNASILDENYDAVNKPVRIIL